jgi:ABC-type branched-subunit amino acid transport system substrate-binding protein
MQRIALLAPFEGRNSEVGYDAHYAARLALADAGNLSVELVAIDDGGSVTNAVDRARALAKDPLVRAVIAVGYDAASKDTQAALARLPMLVVGHWQAQPETATVFILGSQRLSSILTTPSSFHNVTDAGQINFPAVGGEVFALQQFPLLNPDYRKVTIASSASLPDETFRERFMNSGLYVPEPGLLATLTYDAVGMVLEAMQQDDVTTALASQSYEGLNGTIQFEDGYWVNAPIHYYQYRGDGELVMR